MTDENKELPQALKVAIDAISESDGNFHVAEEKYINVSSGKMAVNNKGEMTYYANDKGILRKKDIEARFEAVQKDQEDKFKSDLLAAYAKDLRNGKTVEELLKDAKEEKGYLDDLAKIEENNALIIMARRIESAKKNDQVYLVSPGDDHPLSDDDKKNLKSLTDEAIKSPDYDFGNKAREKLIDPTKGQTRTGNSALADEVARLASLGVGAPSDSEFVKMQPVGVVSGNLVRYL